MARKQLLDKISRKVDGPRTKVPVCDTYAVGSRVLDEIEYQMDAIEAYNVPRLWWKKLKQYIKRKRKHSKRKGGK